MYTTSTIGHDILCVTTANWTVVLLFGEFLLSPDYLISVEMYCTDCKPLHTQSGRMIRTVLYCVMSSKEVFSAHTCTRRVRPVCLYIVPTHEPVPLSTAHLSHYHSMPRPYSLVFYFSKRCLSFVCLAPLRESLNLAIQERRSWTSYRTCILLHPPACPLWSIVHSAWTNERRRA